MYVHMHKYEGLHINWTYGHVYLVPRPPPTFEIKSGRRPGDKANHVATVCVCSPNWSLVRCDLWGMLHIN